MSSGHFGFESIYDRINSSFRLFIFGSLTLFFKTFRICVVRTIPAVVEANEVHLNICQECEDCQNNIT